MTHLALWLMLITAIVSAAWFAVLFICTVIDTELFFYRARLFRATGGWPNAEDARLYGESRKRAAGKQ